MRVLSFKRTNTVFCQRLTDDTDVFLFNLMHIAGIYREVSAVDRQLLTFAPFYAASRQVAAWMVQ